MGRLRRLFGRDDGETQEQYIRRMGAGRASNGYVQPVVPSLVEFYDRIEQLEARVTEIEARAGRS